MSLRRYETLILLSPNLGKPELATFKNKVDGILALGRGKIVRFEDWGRRRLAYPVKKEIYGNYFLYDFQGVPALAAELERNLKIDEQVFKFLTIVLDKDFTEARLEETLSALAKEAQKREADKAPTPEAAAAEGEANADASNDQSPLEGADAPDQTADPDSADTSL
ncbi:MAG: 30S ribosomal protein S6 [Deltaproteobacteria bacterium]|jgi:small subunit ribosomal protein S6|nr:30S ribosomal protein S6 [Deltaproteobacteria bacterium]